MTGRGRIGPGGVKGASPCVNTLCGRDRSGPGEAVPVDDAEDGNEVDIKEEEEEEDGIFYRQADHSRSTALAHYGTTPSFFAAYSKFERASAIWEQVF